MPAVSRKQFGFMAAIAAGAIKRPGLSRATAAHFVHATKNVKRLPLRAHKRRK